MRVVEGGDDQVLKHLDVVFRDNLRIDFEGLHLFGTVHDHGHHPAAGVPLDAGLGHLLLQAILHLLRLLHHLLHLLKVHLHFLDVADLRRENLEHRLHTGVSQRLLAQRGFPVGGLLTLLHRRLARRRGRALGLHGGNGKATTRGLLCD
jgi:hypothetical protein